MHKIFRYPRFSETLKGRPRIFWHCEKKSFRRKIVIPSIMHKIFSIPQTFWNIEGMPTKFFSTVRQKFLDGILWYPLLCIKFFRYPKFSETLKGCQRIFSALWNKSFSTETLDTPIMHKLFPIPQFFWNNEGMPTKFFGSVRQKSFRQVVWYPLLCINFSDTPIFSETLKGCPRSFSALWDKNFSTETCDTPYYA